MRGASLTGVPNRCAPPLYGSSSRPRTKTTDKLRTHQLDAHRQIQRSLCRAIGADENRRCITSRSMPVSPADRLDLILEGVAVESVREIEYTDAAQRETPRRAGAHAPLARWLGEQRVLCLLIRSSTTRSAGARASGCITSSEQACDDPERTNGGSDPAVITDDGEISFRELDERANRAARYLRRRGVKPGDRVAILVNKSVYTYVALLAVLKNNAAFVPLDPGFPKDRAAFICSDAEVETIVTLSKYEDCVTHIDATRILLDVEADEIAKEDASRLSPEESGDDTEQLAYIIYTSGSTGNPKGVACEHASACNFIAVAAETYGIRSDDRMYQGMTIAFDFSFEELWVPLAAGAALVPGQPDANLLGADLHQLSGGAQSDSVGLCADTACDDRGRSARNCAFCWCPARPARATSSVAGTVPIASSSTPTGPRRPR